MTFTADGTYISCDTNDCVRSILRDKRYPSGFYSDYMDHPYKWKAFNDNGIWFHYCYEHANLKETIPVDSSSYYCDRCKTNRIRSQIYTHDYMYTDDLKQLHYKYCTICNHLTDDEVALLDLTAKTPPKGIQSDIETVFSRADPDAMIALGRVLAFGERKYQYQDVPVGQENWRHITVRDHWDHAMEHMWKELREMKSGPQPNDEDAGTHMEHALCRMMFCLAMKLSEKNNEN